ncbi:hypothetical protein Thi970DRAFT_01508 [Thiorhodovibrio frisius]|uniref:Uncharacterized protein n=1 Tax=Thiorhodovibrio frisius TaxID=631362 RepID=H8Z0S3_9GAMM|nr:hypothetical protein Thi970DRAFT_01508 [Thiorhodovibrio frisius]WPL23888.1 hypothetical protein Thiofri_04097 [Thiorhodovibrio frisius]
MGLKHLANLREGLQRKLSHAQGGFRGIDEDAMRPSNSFQAEHRSESSIHDLRGFITKSEQMTLGSCSPLMATSLLKLLTGSLA